MSDDFNIYVNLIKDTDNRRNGRSKKSLMTTDGELEIKVPRDWNGEPRGIISTPKYPSAGVQTGKISPRTSSTRRKS